MQLFTMGMSQVLTCGMVLWLSHGGVMYWLRTACQSTSHTASQLDGYAASGSLHSPAFTGG